MENIQLVLPALQVRLVVNDEINHSVHVLLFHGVFVNHVKLLIGHGTEEGVIVGKPRVKDGLDNRWVSLLHPKVSDGLINLPFASQFFKSKINSIKSKCKVILELSSKLDLSASSLFVAITSHVEF